MSMVSVPWNRMFVKIVTYSNRANREYTEADGNIMYFVKKWAQFTYLNVSMVSIDDHNSYNVLILTNDHR